MTIDTTMYVHITIIKQIADLALLMDKSRNNLIITLLKQAMKRHVKLIKSSGRVRYQDSDTADNWETVHVRFKKHEYEFFQDLRRLYKMSVSLILACAVKMYLKETSDAKKSDNYTFHSHALTCEIAGNAICWKLHWQFPPPDPHLS
jgi:hypothetical protein